MIAFLLSPLGRWAAVGAVLAALAAWGSLERLGRLAAASDARAARAAVEGCEVRVRNMEVRRDEDARAASDPDPVGSLLDRWGR